MSSVSVRNYTLVVLPSVRGDYSYKDKQYDIFTRNQCIFNYLAVSTNKLPKKSSDEASNIPKEVWTDEENVQNERDSPLSTQTSKKTANNRKLGTKSSITSADILDLESQRRHSDFSQDGDGLDINYDIEIEGDSFTVTSSGDYRAGHSHSGNSDAVGGRSAGENEGLRTNNSNTLNSSSHQPTDGPTRKAWGSADPRKPNHYHQNPDLGGKKLKKISLTKKRIKEMSKY